MSGAISSTGMNYAMRHMSRTLGVNLLLIKVCLGNMLVKHPAIETEKLRAIIVTKFFALRRRQRGTTYEGMSIYSALMNGETLLVLQDMDLSPRVVITRG